MDEHSLLDLRLRNSRHVEMGVRAIHSRGKRMGKAHGHIMDDNLKASVKREPAEGSGETDRA